MEFQSVEFRVFLPLLVELDSCWIPQDLRTQYSAAVSAVVAFMERLRPADQRVDDYVVVKDYCGLKLRGGAKLELKRRECRYDPSGFFAEKWAKVLSGPGSVEGSMEEIMHLLGPVSSNTLRDRVLIRRKRMVSVEKRRSRMDPVAHVDREMCYLLPQDCMNRRWVSFTVESYDIEQIKDCLLSSSDTPKPLWEALRLAASIAQTSLEIAREASFVPMVGGYPAWVRLVDLAASLEECVEVVTDLNVMLTSLGY